MLFTVNMNASEYSQRDKCKLSIKVLFVYSSEGTQYFNHLYSYCLQNCNTKKRHINIAFVYQQTYVRIHTYIDILVYYIMFDLKDLHTKLCGINSMPNKVKINSKFSYSL